MKHTKFLIKNGKLIQFDDNILPPWSTDNIIRKLTKDDKEYFNLIEILEKKYEDYKKINTGI
jgi:hypothetical protein